MTKRLEGRPAIVTGAARGMGFSIAKALYDEGAKVALTDIDEKTVMEAAASLDPDESKVIGRKTDVRKKDEVQSLVKEVADKWGGLQILVNNAGGALHTPHVLSEIKEEDWDLVVDVNLKGAFFFCQAAIPVMADCGGGSIVNISALAAHWRASLAGVQYTAAKGGRRGAHPAARLRLGQGRDSGERHRPHRDHDRRTRPGSLGSKKRGRQAESPLSDSLGTPWHSPGGGLGRRFSLLGRIRLYHRDYHRRRRRTIS